MRAGFRVFSSTEKNGKPTRAMMIHISRDGDQFGPYSPEQVQEYLASGQLLPTDLAWYEGAADWVPVTEIAGGAAMPCGRGVLQLRRGDGCGSSDLPRVRPQSG